MKDYMDIFEPVYVDVSTALQAPADKGFYAKGGKRIFDLVLAVLLLPLIAPAIAALWLLVRRDGGPGFFGHIRVGRNGQEFKCWKVRTMVMGAEDRLQAYLAFNPAAAAEWARDHKLTSTRASPGLATSCANPAWMNCRRSGMC